jgi:hypothetical protein
MNTLRRIFITAIAASAVAGVASADQIISYTTSITSPTELVNVAVNLPAWNPGGANTTASDAAGGQYSVTQTGVTMNSLSTAGVAYNLQSYDIYVGSQLVGTYQATAGANGASGSFHIDNYTALSEGTTMPSLVGQIDPANDVFYKDGQTPDGGGPDVVGASNPVSLLANQLSSVYTVNGFTDADLGCVLKRIGRGQTPANCDTPSPFITTGLSSVEAANLLNFYVSTLTSTDSSFSGSGNITSTFTTSVTESVTIAYDYTTSAVSTTPEPTTMVLFGTALVGLGLLRKRVRNQ